ncbi:hypothetical protein SCP_0301400 [Sparassis crispa]|uniref:C2H2-type domain-containing protein n=1 Tax=Sparassis crispa TaxID=139825 RepID=A0A401GE75_9APHY|nr:hypothetical protein SCP_0301400 [Sparassis crispa]GBE80425.1 hypothetical protein SCP_0301400 [Sparassis crispa]
MRLISPSKIPPLAVVLSLESIIGITKEVVQPIPISCEWGICKAELNSWSALFHHMQLHLQAARNKDRGFECCFQKCTGRIQGTYSDLESHVELSHLVRVHLPCPVQGCSQVFARHGQVSIHFQEDHPHLIDKTVPFKSHVLKSMRQPSRIHIAQLAPIPSEMTELFHLLSYPVARACKRAQRLSQESRISRKWSRMMASQDTEDSADAQPFDNLTKFEPPANFNDFIVWRKPSEPAMQLSRPQFISVPSIPEVPPLLSMSYKAFFAKFKELEKAGLVDGTGEWPESDEGEDVILPGPGPQPEPS